MSASKEEDAPQKASRLPHITALNAESAIKLLDACAFPERKGDVDSTVRRKRVADVEAAAPFVHRRPNTFTHLTGISRLRKEKARYQKRQKSQPFYELLKERGSQTASMKDGEGPSSSTYQPFSLPQLLKRLSTFSRSTYTISTENNPSFSPLNMALHGWLQDDHTTQDEVVCVTCRSQWSVRQQHINDDGKVQQESRKALQASHLTFCPWKLRSSSASLYSVPIRSRMETEMEIGDAAKHLQSSDGFERIVVDANVEQEVFEKLAAAFPHLSASALLMSLFGWKVADGSKPVAECIVTCNFCARRAGLWAFESAKNKCFHVAREHKPYCPVINGDIQSGQWQTRSVAQRSPSVRIAQRDNYPAWELKLRVLCHSSHEEKSRASENKSTNRTSLRTMRSHEILAQVKHLLG